MRPDSWNFPLLLHVVDRAQDTLGELGHREGLGRNGEVVAVSGQVPRDHVEDIAEVLGAPAPEGGGRGAERRAGDEQRQLGAVRGAGEADRGDRGNAHGCSSWESRRARRNTSSMVSAQVPR